MKKIKIKESVKIPGTNIILEKNDQIYLVRLSPFKK